MVELTDIQNEIYQRLTCAISGHNFNEVEKILKNGDNNDIQQALKKAFSDHVFYLFNTAEGENVTEEVTIYPLLWNHADQRTRDSLCTEEFLISYLEAVQERIGESINYNTQVIKPVIQKMEDHKKVMDLNYKLYGAIRNLNVNQVKAALENCGEDVKSVLERKVYWNNRNVDAFLVYPLRVEYKGDLDKEAFEKIKESFKLMFDAASPSLLGFELNGNNYVMDRLTYAQKRFAKIPGVDEQCFQDLIQEFEERLSKDELDNAKTNDQIARDNAYAIQFSNDSEGDAGLVGQNPVSNIASPPPTASLSDNKKEDPIINNIAATSTNSNKTNAEPTGKTPEKNDTTFWSEHKGKIALGAAVVCVAGAVAAYVLAYPAVVLALTVLAAVILMGAGIAKVCEKVEDPSVEKPFTPQQGVH